MSTAQQHASTSSHSSSSNSNIIGVHFRVGRKIGEGSFGVIFEGQSAVFPVALLHRGKERSPRTGPCTSHSVGRSVGERAVVGHIARAAGRGHLPKPCTIFSGYGLRPGRMR